MPLDFTLCFVPFSLPSETVELWLLTQMTFTSLLPHQLSLRYFPPLLLVTHHHRLPPQPYLLHGQ